MKQSSICCILVLTLILASQVQSYTCPSLSCESELGDNVCFKHPGESPVKNTIKTYKCSNGTWCYLEQGKHAWVKASQQSISTSTNKNISQVYFKQTQKTCEDITAFQQLLQNGRSCQFSQQCLSKKCSDAGKCEGLKDGFSCSEHEQCDIGLGCIPALTFPFLYTCQPLLDSGSNCTNDMQCKLDHFCWYPTPTHASKKITQCAELYSQDAFSIIGYISNSQLTTLFNSLAAGQYCKSGIAKILNATAAMCVEISNISSNVDQFAKYREFPYYCNLTFEYNSPNGCRYYYIQNGTASVIANDYCECSLQSELNVQSLGVCPIPDQDQLSSYAQATKFMLQNSNCHTSDRKNLGAQKDCGIGKDNYNAWVQSVDLQFNMTYWPYIQSTKNNECLSQVMSTSFQTLVQTNALYLRIAFVPVMLFTAVLGLW